MNALADGPEKCPSCGRCPNCGHIPGTTFIPWPGYPKPYVGDWPVVPYQPTVIYGTFTTGNGNYC